MSVLNYLNDSSPRTLGFKKVRADYVTQAIPDCRNLTDYLIADVLLVQKVPKFKGNFKKYEYRNWRIRYCVVKDDNLYIYKNEQGKSEDKETAKYDLKKARNLKYFRTIRRPETVATKENKIWRPSQWVEILDQSKNNLRLSFKDSNEIERWLEYLLKVFNP